MAGPEAQIQCARDLVEAGALEAAEELYQSAIAETSDPNWLAELAETQALRGNFTMAAATLQRAIAAGSDQFGYWRANLADALRRIRRQDLRLASMHWKEKDSEWYDAIYATNEIYRLHYSIAPYLPVWKEIIALIDAAGYSRVLEIGCGTGQLAAALLDTMPHLSYTGFDLSGKAVEMARTACPRGVFLVGDACQPEIFLNTQYDVVVCTEVLEHIASDLEVIKNCGRGAKLIATVPNFDSAAHLRFFKSLSEVYERYLPVLQNMRVTPYTLNDGAAVLYLVTGSVA
jgi:predicted TPR repeat methyltransferase